MEKKTRKKTACTKSIQIFIILGIVVIIVIPAIFIGYKIYQNGGGLKGILAEALEGQEKIRLYYNVNVNNQEYIVSEEGVYVESETPNVHITGFATKKEYIQTYKRLDYTDIHKLENINTLARMFVNRGEDVFVDISSNNETLVTMGNKIYHFRKDLSYIEEDLRNLTLIFNYINEVTQEKKDLAGDVYLIDDLYFVEKAD